jgi:C-terminal processing protease CtpA/Prc
MVEIYSKSFDVEFDDGFIGFELNCSTDGELVVVNLKNGGQAELYEKVKIGDKIVAVNGVIVNSIEEFGHCITERPIRISFLRNETVEFIRIEDYETDSNGSDSLEIDPRAELSDFPDY